MTRSIGPEASTEWDNSILSPEQVELILASAGIPLGDRYPKRAYEMLLVQRTTQLCWNLFDKNVAPDDLRTFSKKLDKLYANVAGAASPPPRGAFDKLQKWAAQELSRPRATRHSRYHARAIPWLSAFFQVAFDQMELKLSAASGVTSFIKCYFDELNQALKNITLEDPQGRGRQVQPFAPKTETEAIRKAIAGRKNIIEQEIKIVLIDLTAATDTNGVKGILE